MRLAVVIVFAASGLGAIAAAQPPATGASTDNVSLDRVRAALDRPPSPTLTVRPPDFAVHIEARRPLQEIFETPPWATAPATRSRYSLPPSPFGSQPLVAVDLLAIANAIVDEVRSVRRAHAEAGAREEVREAIRAYCAAQPNGGAGIQICDNPPARR